MYQNFIALWPWDCCSWWFVLAKLSFWFAEQRVQCPWPGLASVISEIGYDDSCFQVTIWLQPLQGFWQAGLKGSFQHNQNPLRSLCFSRRSIKNADHPGLWLSNKFSWTHYRIYEHLVFCLSVIPLLPVILDLSKKICRNFWQQKIETSYIMCMLIIIWNSFRWHKDQWPWDLSY